MVKLTNKSRQNVAASGFVSVLILIIVLIMVFAIVFVITLKSWKVKDGTTETKVTSENITNTPTAWITPTIVINKETIEIQLPQDFDGISPVDVNSEDKEIYLAVSSIDQSKENALFYELASLKGRKWKIKLSSGGEYGKIERISNNFQNTMKVEEWSETPLVFGQYKIHPETADGPTGSAIGYLKVVDGSLYTYILSVNYHSEITNNFVEILFGGPYSIDNILDSML